MQNIYKCITEVNCDFDNVDEDNYIKYSYYDDNLEIQETYCLFKEE